MRGIIITGHGEFASGLYSSLIMIAGQLDNVMPVTFLDNESEEQLTDKLQLAITMLADCDEIIIMCDLLGGSPFKQAATLSITNPKLFVVYGINLGMLLELSITRNYEQTTASIISSMIESGKRNAGLYIFTVADTEEVIDEGI